MRDVVIIGAGQTPFGEFPDKGVKELFADAFFEAMRSVDHGLDPEMIEAAWIGTLSCGSGFQLGNFAPLLMGHVGLSHVPALRVESACASGSYALLQAVQAVASGSCRVALAAGVEKMRDVSATKTKYWLGISGDTEYERLAGLTFAGIFAMMATRAMEEFGLEREDLSRVAVKNHAHAVHNPKAQFRRTIDLETALRGPEVAFPFNIWDCCPMSDGAACVIVADAEEAGRFTDQPVHVAGWGAASDLLALHDRPSLTSFCAVERAAKKAYAMAGVTPEDLDLAELHDCFTIAELLAYADLGFCRREEIGPFIRSGAAELGGRLPVNVSGGLKAKGHPIGATGIGMAYEIFRQLRGEAESSERQVQGANLALSENVGGSGGSATVIVYRLDGGRVA